MLLPPPARGACNGGLIRGVPLNSSFVRAGTPLPLAAQDQGTQDYFNAEHSIQA